jgi:hypothetical protein
VEGHQLARVDERQRSDDQGDAAAPILRTMRQRTTTERAERTAGTRRIAKTESPMSGRTKARRKMERGGWST